MQVNRIQNADSNANSYFCQMHYLKEKYRKYKNFFPADLWAILLMIFIVVIMLFIIL